MDNNGKIKVMIFEDNKHLRDSLYFLVNTSAEFECIAAFPDTRQALQHVKHFNPDVIIMDIEMPVMNGIDTTRLIKGEFPGMKIMILTVFEDKERIFQALCAGGSGYLLKNSTPQQIIQGLSDTYKGGSPLSPSVAKMVVQFFQLTMPVVNAEDYNLTPKEKELLECLADGKSYKMIADKMGISIETVKTHIKSVYRKLHVNSSHEAVAKVIRQRIV
ncbi:MAG TPA: response regulator transcription factor [Chitinophagaceae bacterium]|nr:response regulator transcription factor [Chitinophagaceae bacterium]